MANWTKLADGSFGVKLNGKEANLNSGDTVTVISRKGKVSKVHLGEMISKARVTRIFSVYQPSKYDADYASEQRYFGFASDGERLNHRSDPYDSYDYPHYDY